MFPNSKILICMTKCASWLDYVCYGIAVVVEIQEADRPTGRTRTVMGKPRDWAESRFSDDRKQPLAVAAWLTRKCISSARIFRVPARDVCAERPVEHLISLHPSARARAERFAKRVAFVTREAVPGLTRRLAANSRSTAPGGMKDGGAASGYGTTLGQCGRDIA